MRIASFEGKTSKTMKWQTWLLFLWTCRMSDLTAALAEQTRRREEAMHALSLIQREKDHAAEAERIKLQSKIAETAEEVSKKILQKEIKLREESQQKFALVEQVRSAFFFNSVAAIWLKGITEWVSAGYILDDKWRAGSQAQVWAWTAWWGWGTVGCNEATYWWWAGIT